MSIATDGPDAKGNSAAIRCAAIGVRCPATVAGRPSGSATARSSGAVAAWLISDQISLLCDNCKYAVLEAVAEVEAHDEVAEWLSGLGKADWERVVVVIDRLAMLGFQARMPLSRSLGEGLFELRFSPGSTARRITYRFSADGRIILLTTFRKQKSSERMEIARARKVAEDCARLNP